MLVDRYYVDVIWKKNVSRALKPFKSWCIELHKLLLIHNNYWKSILLTSNESVSSSSSLDLSVISTKALETGIILLIDQVAA